MGLAGNAEEFPESPRGKVLVILQEKLLVAFAHEDPPQDVFTDGDDVEVAQGFEAWCRRRNIEPNVDVLLIDTSHLFEHTCREIESWFPYLSERSKVCFSLETEPTLRGRGRPRAASSTTTLNNPRIVMASAQQVRRRRSSRPGAPATHIPRPTRRG